MAATRPQQFSSQNQMVRVEIESMGTERGHRTLVITRKGGKVVTIPLAPPTDRGIDLAIGQRCEGVLAGQAGSGSCQLGRPRALMRWPLAGRVPGEGETC